MRFEFVTRSIHLCFYVGSDSAHKSDERIGSSGSFSGYDKNSRSSGRNNSSMFNKPDAEKSNSVLKEIVLTGRAMETLRERVAVAFDGIDCAEVEPVLIEQHHTLWNVTSATDGIVSILSNIILGSKNRKFAKKNNRQHNLRSDLGIGGSDGTVI